MGYDLKEGGGFGCLAGVHNRFANPDEYGMGIGDTLTALMYSRSGEWYPYPWEGLYSPEKIGEEKEVYVRAAIAEAARALPVGVFLSISHREEILRTGEIVIHKNSKPATIHSRMAPFRIFIERPDSIEFFNRAKEHGSTLAAFIACHFYCIDRLNTTKDDVKFKDIEGWHQSMFPDVTPRGLCLGDNPRRVVALYPKYRKLFGNQGRTMEDSYIIPCLSPEVRDRIERALSTLAYTIPPNSNTDMAGCVAWYQQWHDIIINECEVICNED